MGGGNLYHAGPGVLEAKPMNAALFAQEQHDASRKFDAVEGFPRHARAIEMLKRQSAMPAPEDPAHLAEMAQLASKLGAAYGSGKYCKNPEDPKSCRNLNQLSETMAKSRDWNEDLEAWQGWHTVGRGMRADYQRFADLLNEGARDNGYADAGEAWRSSYDMDPDALRAETDRLWGQVKPLYPICSATCAEAGRKVCQRMRTTARSRRILPQHVAQDWSACIRWCSRIPA